MMIEYYPFDVERWRQGTQDFEVFIHLAAPVSLHCYVRHELSPLSTAETNTSSCCCSEQMVLYIVINPGAAQSGLYIRRGILLAIFLFTYMPLQNYKVTQILYPHERDSKLAEQLDSTEYMGLFGCEFISMFFVFIKLIKLYIYILN